MRKVRYNKDLIGTVLKEDSSHALVQLGESKFCVLKFGLKDFFYCQRQIEGLSMCEGQCDHCKEYYKPLEKLKSGEGTVPIKERELQKNTPGKR